MRPQGQLKNDGALPDSNDKSRDRSTESQGWGNPADLRPPGAQRAVKKRAETVPLALGAPPPPAGAAGGEDDADPVAGLFASDRAVPAPGINDAPSEAEIGRWVATAQTSLFDDRVKDPAPAPARVAAAAPASTREGARRQGPKLLDLDASPDPVAIPGMSEPEPLQPRKPRAPAPPAPAPAGAAPAPAPPAPAAKAKRVGSASGARKRSAVAPAAPAPAQAPEPTADPEATDPAVKPARKRRIERGPSKALLIGVGAGALLALGATAVLLDIVPNGSEPATVARPPRVGAAAAAPAKLAPAAKPAALAAKPAALAAKPLALAAKPPAPAPVAVAKPSSAGPAHPLELKAAPAIAAQPKPAVPAAPRAKAPTVAPAAASAPVASAVEEREDEAEESAGGGSGKLLVQARKLLTADNPAGAEALARQALAADPQDHHAMDVLARALMDQDRGQEAIPLARKMVQKRAKRVPYRLLLGDLLLMVGDEAGARAEWQKALELSPNDREIKRRLGQ